MNNQITAIGRLTAPPELRFTPQGTPASSFTITYNDYGTKPVKTEGPIAASDRAVMVREVALVLGLSAQLSAAL